MTKFQEVFDLPVNRFLSKYYMNHCFCNDANFVFFVFVCRVGLVAMRGRNGQGMNEYYKLELREEDRRREVQ